MKIIIDDKKYAAKVEMHTKQAPCIACAYRVSKDGQPTTCDKMAEIDYQAQEEVNRLAEELQAHLHHDDGAHVALNEALTEFLNEPTLNTFKLSPQLLERCIAENWPRPVAPTIDAAEELVQLLQAWREPLPDYVPPPLPEDEEDDVES